MSLAGHGTVIYLKASSASAVAGDEVDGVKSASVNINGELLDITDFKDTSGWHSRLQGLKDSTLELSGDTERADAPQTLLRSAILDGSSVWATVHTNPAGGANAKGYKAEYKVESYNEDSAVEDLVTFSATLKSTGAVALE